MVCVCVLMPLSAFSQKSRKPGVAKTGRLVINVLFEAVNTIKVSRGDGGYATSGEHISKLTARYQYTESNKAISHDGFVSVTEPSAKSTTGRITYEFDGKSVESAPDGSSTTTEKVVFAGNIGETGNGGVEMADSGDSIVGVNAAAFVDATGSRIQTVRDNSGTRTDKSCDIGLTSITFATVSDPEPDASKPAESACRARLENSVNAIKRPADSPFDDNWSPISVLGSFANGNYTFHFKGSRLPQLRQKNEDGETQVYREDLTIDGTYTLSTGTARTVSVHENRTWFDLLAILPRRLVVPPA